MIVMVVYTPASIKVTVQVSRCQSLLFVIVLTCNLIELNKLSIILSLCILISIKRHPYIILYPRTVHDKHSVSRVWLISISQRALTLPCHQAFVAASFIVYKLASKPHAVPIKKQRIKLYLSGLAGAIMMFARCLNDTEITPGCKSWLFWPIITTV